MRLLHAGAILVGDGTTIVDGAIVLDGDRVVEIGPAAALIPQATGASIVRLPGVVFPGLVNAHTHLELSGLRGLPAGAGFAAWLDALQTARAHELEEERDAAIDRALDDLETFGVVAVGDVTNGLSAARRLSRRFSAVIWHEIFALDPVVGRARIEEARRAHEDLGLSKPPILAPHALYSTHPEVVAAILALRRPGDPPFTIHLAEHAAERAFLRDGGGPLRAFYDRRRLPAAAFPIPGRAPIEVASALGLLRDDATLVHLADARPEELDAIAAAGSVVVLCPRSNLQIETRYPPLLALRARGIPIALGTDSLASAPSLDPLAEAKALLDRTPEVSAAALVAAATSGGARALGLEGVLGLLARGRRPGIFHVAVEIGGDPSAALLRSLSRPRVRIASGERA
jgi:cytosine/adenosine deaminase-related metal-dependent hydrolase